MRTTAFIIAALIAGCASTATPPAVPDNLKVSAGEALSHVAPATGVQIYDCGASKVKPGSYEWNFRAPEAELFDTSGRKIGKHYGGPTWEANDGSKIVGALKARDDGPDVNAIPWLLLSAKSTGPAGTFSRVTSIQRVNTVGGSAPSDGCSAATVGKEARVHYTADYRFFTPRY